MRHRVIAITTAALFVVAVPLLSIAILATPASAAPLAGVAAPFAGAKAAGQSNSGFESARYVTRCSTIYVRRMIKGRWRRVARRRCRKVWVR
jgi:hypothetical protein